MRKKLSKITSIEEAVDLIHIGVTKSVSGIAEYRGSEYTVEVRPKDAPESSEPAPQMLRGSPKLDAMMLATQLEETLLGPESEARDHINELLWLTLPAGYSFKVTFPFCGAAARFLVCKADHPERSVSVYLDTKDVLGCVGQPYWEAYPIKGDTERWLLGESDELIAAIVAELEGDPRTRESGTR